MPNATIHDYLNNNKKLIQLNGKVPIVKNWVNKEIPKDTILNHAKNGGTIGWALGENDLVVDVDVKNNGKGLESFEKLQADLNIEIEKTVLTSSGGFHCYLSIPEKYRGLSFRKKINDKYPDIDFLTKGSQCVTPTNNDYDWHDDNFFGGFQQCEAPVELLELLSNDHKIDIDNNDVDEDDDYDVLNDVSDINDERVEEILSKISSKDDYHDYLQVGMALHHWNRKRGLKFWIEWAKESDKFDIDDIEKRWKSFKSKEGGVTLKTLIHKGRQEEKKVKRLVLQECLDFIENCKNREDLEDNVVPKIKKHTFIIQLKNNRDDVDYVKDYELLVNTYQKTYKALTGLRINKEIARKTFITNEEKEDLACPDWCKDWIQIDSHDRYFNIKDHSLIKSTTFNVRNGCKVPPSEKGYKQSAVKFIADNGFVQSADNMAYLPQNKDLICKLNGRTYVNTYNRNTIPKTAKQFTEDGERAIERIEKHIKFLCNNNDDIYSHLIMWLAHQVQFTGKKILWSPVIQGIQGCGKSFLGHILRTCMGKANVGTVATGQVNSSFNSWATSVAVNILEELRLSGNNRYNTLDTLKPLVTDEYIQINEKGISQYNTLNTTNYIAFTNHKDALPLSTDDRRWFVIFVGLQRLDDIKSATGEDANVYFSKLFEALKTHQNEIRKWLLEYKITDSFLSLKQAPMTEHKQNMINTEEVAIEGFIELKELLAEGGEFFNEDVLSSADLFNAFDNVEGNPLIQTSKKRQLLKRLGYVSHGPRVKIGDKARQIWYKHTMTNSEIRDAFKR